MSILHFILDLLRAITYNKNKKKKGRGIAGNPGTVYKTNFERG